MGFLMRQAGWTVLHLPALAEKNDALGRLPGQALWPSQYPAEALEDIRRDIGPRAFACLYQGNVSAAQGTIFKRDWFRKYATAPEKFIRVIQSWDTAFKTGATNDYSVCATIGETQNGFYLLHLYRNKVEFPQLKRVVGELAEQWRPSEIYVEDKASGQSLVQELKLSTNFPIIPVKVDRDKESRASAVTGYFESGRVLFPEGAPWVADLEDELASFPGGLHDDCVDALSQALNRLRSGGDDLGLVTWMKNFAAGIVSIAKPKPAPVLVMPSPQLGICTSHTETCGNPLHIFLANQVHCNSCGASFWPNGVKRSVQVFNRKNLPQTRIAG
jgi:predicted phage terminase large subunit-like protein